MSQTKPTDAQIDAYAHHYVIHGIQAEAWRQAFPDNKAKAETQHVKASEFHALDKVQRRVAELREIARKQSEEHFQLSASQIKEMLLWAAQRGMASEDGDFMSHDRMPSDVRASIQALAEINRMDGNHAATKLAMGQDPDAEPVEHKVIIEYV